MKHDATTKDLPEGWKSSPYPSDEAVTEVFREMRTTPLEYWLRPGHCDKEGNPIDTFTYPTKDSNRLVEEYMLLANYLVAQKLILGAKNLAAIRRHPGPHPKKLQEYAEQCKTRGFEIDVSSAGKLHSSLLRLHAHPLLRLPHGRSLQTTGP